MKSIFVIAATVAATFALNAQAAMDDAQMKAFEKECNGYALEENIPEDEMQGYVEQCVQDLVAAQAEGGEQSEEGASEE